MSGLRVVRRDFNLLLPNKNPLKRSRFNDCKLTLRLENSFLKFASGFGDSVTYCRVKLIIIKILHKVIELPGGTSSTQR